jgi:hypothetical protein
VSNFIQTQAAHERIIFDEAKFQTRRKTMRASLFVIAAVTALTAVVPASSVSAQGVTIEGPGVGVRVGNQDRYRERDGREERREGRYYRDRATVGGEGCRTVTVKKRMPDGSVVVRRKSSC